MKINSAVDHKAFERTQSVPARRVVPDTKPEAAPQSATDPAPAKPAKEAAAATKLAALIVLVLVLILGRSAPAATTSFIFTNDIATPMTTMFYTNAGTAAVPQIFFLQATNTAPGTSNTISTTLAVQGVAIQGTNADLARLVPLASTPGNGSAISLLISNTAAWSAGVPKNTAQFGTNIPAGLLFTAATGTNITNPTWNTNLP